MDSKSIGYTAQTNTHRCLNTVSLQAVICKFSTILKQSKSVNTRDQYDCVSVTTFMNIKCYKLFCRHKNDCVGCSNTTLKSNHCLNTLNIEITDTKSSLLYVLHRTPLPNIHCTLSAIFDFIISHYWTGFILTSRHRSRSDLYIVLLPHSRFLQMFTLVLIQLLFTCGCFVFLFFFCL